MLQEQRFERVGGNATLETDVRIIAATNCNLEQMVADGQFRGDLYYRLNGFTIHLPALRDRGDDLLLLLEHFLHRFRHELGKEVHGISPDALQLLMHYAWPGNVRELQSVLRQSLLQAAGPVIIPDFLPEVVHREHGLPRVFEASDDLSSNLAAAGGKPVASRFDESLCRNRRIDGAISDHASAPRDRRQSIARGDHSGHHARLPATKNSHAENRHPHVDRRPRADAGRKSRRRRSPLYRAPADGTSADGTCGERVKKWGLAPISMDKTPENRWSRGACRDFFTPPAGREWLENAPARL